MIKKNLFVWVVLSGAMLLNYRASATHLRAGEIIVIRNNCTSLTFTITIFTFTNTGSDISFGNGVFDLGDGNAITTPEVQNQIRVDLGENLGFAAYSVEHTYGGPGRYVISYLEPNRNAGVLNMLNSVDTRFYVETVINIDPFLGCNSSPDLLVPPIDGACTGVAWFHNPGAYDPDDDSLSYELTIPKSSKDQFVARYREPNAEEFYTSIGMNYNTANEQKNGPPSFSINAVTGVLKWDSPGAAGEYNIAFLIKEWRQIEGAWVLLGSVTRDMQIVVEDCENRRPELQIPEDICVEAGTVIDETIFGSDPDGDKVKIEAFSQIFSLNSNPAQFIPSPSAFQSTTPPLRAQQTFRWTTECRDVKRQPYQVVFKITDEPDEGVRLVFFKTWNITVVAPAPIWNEVRPGATANTAALSWDPYACSNATTIEIWRRVDGYNFVPDNCVTGIPDFLGYTKIAETAVENTSYVDDNGGVGLVPGARYCYRLLAAFSGLSPGSGYVSQERCILMEADVPVLTRVSIDRTSSDGGRITVNWMPPFDADPLQFPPPYSYDLYRSEGFVRSSGEVKVHPGMLTDTFFVDTSLDTKNESFNYRVVAFDNNNVEVGTSPSGSTVRLAFKSKVREIDLTWEAEVPWSNKSEKYPWHLIYRGAEGDTEDQMILIDSVKVDEDGFHYVDRGQHNGIPLSEAQKYCYRVMTRGGYGNPAIREPLLNFSQIGCVQPNDIEPPCKPDLNISVTSCDEYIAKNPCDASIFSNTLTWNIPSDPICRDDIKSYNIYVASNRDNNFFLYKTDITGTTFQDTNLPSFARCYRIAAVDHSGNESELTDPICFDNCPYYELPNVFTPNGDPCNQRFSAYRGRPFLDEDESPCGTVDVNFRTRCARFVKGVKFTLFNRWGDEVYNYVTRGEKSIYIDWDGRDNSGNELSAGVYFYVAEITFDVMDPSQRIRTLRNWVQLIR